MKSYSNSLIKEQSNPINLKEYINTLKSLINFNKI